jgi:hypothetical protein
MPLCGGLLSRHTGEIATRQEIIGFLDGPQVCSSMLWSTQLGSS